MSPIVSEGSIALRVHGVGSSAVANPTIVREASVSIRPPSDRVLFGAEDGKWLPADELTMFPSSVRPKALRLLWLVLLAVMVALAVVIFLVWRSV
jgi:hypothetical protein